MAAAPADFLQELPDGHSAVMGACYSTGKGKPSSSSSLPQGAAAMPPRNSPPTPGKARRTQSLSFDSSQKALARNPSSGRDGRTDLDSQRANHVGSGTTVLHTTSLRPSNSSKSLAAGRLQGATNDRADGEAVSCAAGEEFTHTGSGLTNDTSSVMCVTLQQTSAHNIDDGAPSSQTSSSSNVGDNKVDQAHAQISSSNARTSHSMLRNNSDVSAPKTLRGTLHAASSSISSPRRNMQRSASSKSSKSESPFMLSTCTEMKTPSLKSGVGAYEVLTPRKLIAGVRITPPPPLPSKSGNSLRRTGSHNTAAGLKVDLVGANNMAGKVNESSLKGESSPLGTKSQGVKELCKNCKTGTWESVCFIANDGRIAAANTGPATVCHFHHCKSPRCAANPNYQPPSSLPCKKVSLSKTRSSPCLSTDKAEVKDMESDDRTTCSITKSFFHEEESVGHSLTAEKEPDSAEKEPDSEEKTLAITDTCHRSSVSKEDAVFEGVGGNGFCTGQFSLEGGMHNSTQSSPCAERRARGALSFHEGEQIVLGAVPRADDSGHRNHVPDTPSMIRKSDAFGDLARTNLTASDAAKALQARKSNMERMRQRYLDCLKEQEAETVRLRKQEMIARKQAGEWMFDSAIGEILQKLAPDGEAGVKVIVEAFETIMQQSDAEMLQQAGDNVALLER